MASEPQTIPVEGVSIPVEGVSIPVEGVSIPVEGVTVPVEGVTVPVEDIYVPMELRTKAVLKPDEIYYTRAVVKGDDMDLITRLIQQKIASNVGGKCGENGFIKRGSVKLLDRSVGLVDPSGEITYQVSYLVQLCAPTIGQQIMCHIDGKTTAGVRASVKLRDGSPSPVTIFIPNSPGIQQTEADRTRYEDMKVGDTTKIEVLASRYQLGQDVIRVVAKLV